jgi:Flp pilus assembly protein TadD
MNSILNIGHVIAASDAQNAGYTTGRLIAIVGVLIGMRHCVVISRRPATNAKCALALLFALLPTALSGVYALLQAQFAPAVPILFSTVSTVLLAMACAASLIAAVALALVGLIEMFNRKGIYNQGRKQAIWALILSCLVGSTFGVGFVRGFARARNAVLPGSTPATGGTQTFADLNFRFHEPTKPWVSFAAAKLNKDAKLTYMRRNPESYFMIIAERFGAAQAISTEQLAEIGKVHLEAAADSVRVLNQTPSSVNGMRGLLVESEAALRGKLLFYQHWYLATNGYAYQLIGYGRAEDRARILTELRPMFDGFHLLDSHAVAREAGGGFLTNFNSRTSGYSVNVAGSPWRPYKNMSRDLPQAEFGGSRGDSCFVIIPVDLAGHKLQPEQVNAGLLAIFGIAYPDDDLRNRRAYAEGGLTGEMFDFEREVDKVPFRYRMGILHGEDTAFLVAAWASRKGDEGEEIMDDAFARVKFAPREDVFVSVGRELTARERKTQAFVINQAGLHEFRAGDYEQALPLFRAAANSNPAERQYVLNSLRTLSHLERPREALELLDSSGTAALKNTELRAWQAYFQAEDGRTDQARTNYAAVFGQGFRDESLFIHYVRLLQAEHLYTNALQAIADYQVKESSISTRLLEAEVYRLQLDYPRAMQLLRPLHEKSPYNTAVSSALAETCIASGAFSDALDVARDMAAKSPNSAQALYLQGRSELGLRWYREAKASFDAAAKLAPSDKTINSYIDLLRGMLGEGDNSAVREIIDPVPLPAALSKASSRAAPVPTGTNYGASMLRKGLAISWLPGREVRATEYWRIHIADAAGVSAFSTIQRRFDPLAEQLYVNEVRVLDSDGQTISRGAVGNYYVLDEHHETLASHHKILNIPVAGLQPGSDLVVTITRREAGRVFEFPFLEHSFSGTVPVQESFVFLTGNTKGLKYRTAPEREPAKLPDGLCWSWTNPVVARFEPMQVPWNTFAPTLWIAEGAATWSEVASNYLATIAERLAPDAALGDVARKLTAQARTPEAKIATLASYVQTNITYKAIEFGRRARMPNTPAEVLQNKYGDCKDHSVLLQQLLTAAGVPAFLALVSTSDPVQSDLPSLDQFNHMVVYVPGGKGLFVDATDKGSDPLSGSPFGISTRDALILDPRAPRLGKIPAPTEAESAIELRRVVQLVDKENILTRETMVARGAFGAYLRQFFQAVPAVSQKQYFQQRMDMPDAELKELSAEGVQVSSAPLTVTCVYAQKKQFRHSNGSLAGVPRAVLERAFLAAPPCFDRKTPFEVRMPMELKSTVTFEIPAGYSARVPAKLDSRTDGRFLSCTNSWRLEGRSLIAEFECRQPTGTFKAGDYETYRETMSHALSLLERELVFEDEQRASK